MQHRSYNNNIYVLIHSHTDNACDINVALLSRNLSSLTEYFQKKPFLCRLSQSILTTHFPCNKVPAYRIMGVRLHAVLGFGITKGEFSTFMFRILYPDRT